MIEGVLGIAEFVNADVIAQGLSGFDPDRAALQAGKVMLTRLRDLAAARVNFAFESTLSSRTFAPWLSGLRGGGYRVHVVFVFLNSPELAVSRVRARVRKGGHFVPPDVVRRRYKRAIWNLLNLYIPIADAWHVYDNSGASGAGLVASMSAGAAPVIARSEVWEKIHGIAESQQTDDGDRGVRGA